MTARVNVQPRRRGCTVQSDGGVQFTPTTLFSFKRRRCSTGALYSELSAKLTEQQNVMLQKIKDNHTELMNLGERDAFRRGFSLAVRLMMEAMAGEKT